MADAKEAQSWKNDPNGVQRGDYGFNLMPTLVFSIGRLSSGPLSWYIVSKLPFARYGFAPPGTGGYIKAIGVTIPRLYAITALMPATLGLQNVIWANFMAKERMHYPLALFGGVFPVLYEAIASTLFTMAGSNPLWSERMFYTGATMYFGAVLLEVIAEWQRIVFKRDPKNKGKLCTTGFWGITRHINYTCNVVYGFGYGLATGGPLFSLATLGMYLSNLGGNAIPSHEEYCAQKYGEEWKRYEREVPWKLIPGIW